MSAPTYAEKRADHINFSFLSLRAAQALKSALDGEQLQDEDRAVLARAAGFLRDIAVGANVVSTGSFKNGADPVRGVDALDYAIGPLEHFQQAMVDKDIAEFFDNLAGAIGQIAQSVEPLTDELRQAAIWAIEFFDFLYKSLAATLDVKPKRSGYLHPDEGWRTAAAA